jgi:hypothetical protein
MRDVAIRQDIKELILDAADRLLNQFGYRLHKQLSITKKQSSGTKVLLI